MAIGWLETHVAETRLRKFQSRLRRKHVFLELLSRKRRIEMYHLSIVRQMFEQTMAIPEIKRPRFRFHQTTTRSKTCSNWFKHKLRRKAFDSNKTIHAEPTVQLRVDKWLWILAGGDQYGPFCSVFTGLPKTVASNFAGVCCTMARAQAASARALVGEIPSVHPCATQNSFGAWPLEEKANQDITDKNKNRKQGIWANAWTCKMITQSWHVATTWKQRQDVIKPMGTSGQSCHHFRLRCVGHAMWVRVRQGSVDLRVRWRK